MSRIFVVMYKYDRGIKKRKQNIVHDVIFNSGLLNKTDSFYNLFQAACLKGRIDTLYFSSLWLRLHEARMCLVLNKIITGESLSLHIWEERGESFDAILKFAKTSLL